MNKNLIIPSKNELDISSLASESSFITILFPKSTSKSYPMALSLAKLAETYREGTWIGKNFHLACFGRKNAQVSLASKVCSLIGGLKGTMGFINGSREVPLIHLSYVLSCYSSSLYAEDKPSYCNVTSIASGWKMILPCRLLSGRECGIIDASDSSIDKKIQSLAVKASCDWCPNFDPKKTKFII